ncbi:MAG: hypothetical protein JWQ74_3141, partial [Marmoricola sp.]|nr:hypothetical protein [Marmoricola sp.]
MRFPSLRRTVPALAAVAVAVALAPVAGGAPTPTNDLSSEATYTCQYSGILSAIKTPEGLPIPSLGFDLPSLGGSDAVTVATKVTAPRAVVPGQALKISGTSTFTFGPSATLTSLSTVFAFLSDDFGVEVKVGSYQRLLRIANLSTAKSKVANPVVTARWTLPEFLVPSSASGKLVLSLPGQPIVTNPVSTSPKAVAFTGALRSDSFLLPSRLVACALKAGQDTALGAITVGTSSEAPPTTPTASSTPQAGGPVAPPGPTGPGLAAPVASPAGAGAVAPAAPIAQGQGVTTVLAGDPIPPATVADGLRLPPWALLLIGAFVAGGLFAGASSYRRVRLLPVAAVGLALIVVVAPLTPQPAAQAASGRTQVTLICVYNDTGAAADARARDQPTGLSISLDVPASVTPGEVITLTGSASVQAPEDIRSQAAQLGFTQLDAISDTLSVGLTVGSGKRQVFTADRWQTGKTNFGNPLVVSAPLYFPSFRVPANASGSIQLDLPRNEVLKRRPPPHSNAHTPPRTALEFVATVSGNGARATYLVDCWRTDKGNGRIATIPVVKATAPSSGQGGTGTTKPGSAPAPAAVPTPGATSAPGAAPAPGAATAGARPTSTVAAAP